MSSTFMSILIFLTFFIPKIVSCPSGTFEGLEPNLCYQPIKEPSTWFNAEYNCANHLASVDDGFFNGIFVGEATAAFGGKFDSFWIGKTTLYDPRKWAWSDGSNGTFENWAPGHPKTNKGLYCLSVNLSDGTWHNEDCNLKKPYICQNIQPPEETNRCVSKCPKEWVFLEKLGKCYLFDTKGDCLNFQEKRGVCQSYGGDMISIHSEQENTVLAGLMSLYTGRNSGYYFIGLHKDKGSWKWVDGTEVNFTNWDANEPQQSAIPNEEYDAAAISFVIKEEFKWHSFIGNFHCNDGTFCQKEPEL